MHAVIDPRLFARRHVDLGRVNSALCSPAASHAQAPSTQAPSTPVLPAPVLSA